MTQVGSLIRAAALSEARRGKRAAEQVRAQLLALAGGAGTALAHAERAWASITFSGTRHHVKLRFDGETAVTKGEVMLVALPEHQFTIPGQIVADVSVANVEHRLLRVPRLDVTVELLLLEEG